MSVQKKKKYKYSNLGAMLHAEIIEDGKPTGGRSFWIKLEQQKDKNGNPYGEQLFPITLANGKQLKDGDELALFDKRKKLTKMVKKNEELAEKNLPPANKMTPELLEKICKHTLFEICVKEPIDEGDDEPSYSSGDEIPF